MEEAALDNRTPERKHHHDPKDRDLNQRTEGDSKASGLEMVASKCHLELGRFPLVYLPQHLT